ncbi:MAG: hypothetical protein AAF750_12135 [Planctomycetota bacterium]
MRRIDVIVLLAVAIAAGVLALVVLDRSSTRGPTPPRANVATQLRGIQQSFIIHAQSNKGYYPGLDSSGNLVDSRLSAQFAMLLDANYFTPDYLINQLDLSSSEAVDYGSGYVVSVFNHSFAGLDLTTPGGRLNAWPEAYTPDEVVVGDRNLGSDAHENTRSFYSGRWGGWEGVVVRNDNSTSYEETHMIETAYTEPTSRPSTAATRSGELHEHDKDNLFEAAGAHDAWLVHD